MRFPDLVEGTLLRRYKRFLADVRLDTGEEVVAHCANPGSMRSVLEPLPRVWLSRARPGRKLAYTWEVAVQGNTLIYVNPTGSNRVAIAALESHALPELDGYDVLQPEVKYGHNSRIDILLTGALGRAYVEVKNVTLDLGGGRAAFPDSVTARGTKHLRELARVAQSGDRAVLLFCVGRTDACSVEAAAEIDPVYARTLNEVAQCGVEVLAYTGPLSKEGFSLRRRLPIRGLPESA